MENKSILVTGGAGFIGSNIVRKLMLEKIRFVRILDNLSSGNKNNIQCLLDKYPNLEFMYGDIRDIEVCRNAVQDIDIICHQAGIVSVPQSIQNPLLTHTVNVTGFINILTVAKEKNITRIVYASSCAVYGDSLILPNDEKHICSVLSPYAITKVIMELYANLYTKCYHMECIGLRYFNVYGLRQTSGEDVISNFMNAIKTNKTVTIFGDGSFSRDFVYVDDVANANILAMTTQNKKTFGEVFNIGSGIQISILTLFNVIKDRLHSDIIPIFKEIRNGDISHSCANINKAKTLLEYNPLVSFGEGVAKTC